MIPRQLVYFLWQFPNEACWCHVCEGSQSSRSSSVLDALPGFGWSLGLSGFSGLLGNVVPLVLVCLGPFQSVRLIHQAVGSWLGSSL